MAGPLLIADVPWLLYRAFFALPKSITDERGRPVNALLGTVNALLSAIQACSPRAVVVCFGAEQAAYRVKLYPPYHAHREPMPSELAQQWARAGELLERFDWTLADNEELEADDVMFSHSITETAAGGRALLLSGDRDMFQAVTDSVKILEVSRDGAAVEFGPAEVIERYGVSPRLVADFIALRGDPSDGLPGAPGVGAKTAAALLGRYGGLEPLLAAAAAGDTEIRPRVAEALRQNTGQLIAFKAIATLVRIDVERAADRPTDFAGGALAASEFGMRRLAQRLAKA